MFTKAVNKDKVVDYEGHLKSSNVFDLKATAAMIITLAEEYREGIETRHTTKVRSFIEKVVAELNQYWTMDENQMNIVKKIIMSNFMGVFGFAASITAQDAAALLKITDQLSKTAERASKIQDGFTFRLSWGQRLEETITQFIEEIVIPEIPNENRMSLALKTKKFFSGLKIATQQNLVNPNLIPFNPNAVPQYILPPASNGGGYYNGR